MDQSDNFYQACSIGDAATAEKLLNELRFPIGGYFLEQVINREFIDVLSLCLKSHKILIPGHVFSLGASSDNHEIRKIIRDDYRCIGRF